VVEVFALEVDLGAAAVWSSVVGGQALSEVEGAGATDVVLEQTVEFRLEGGVLTIVLVSCFQLEEGRHQGFGHVFATELPVATQRIRTVFNGGGVGEFDGCGGHGVFCGVLMKFITIRF
jgi:hypothetical protein